MEALSAVARPKSPPLFNSTLETGLRAVIILEAVYPRSWDLSIMTWLDHVVVHSADLGGPKSLHPDVPARAGEMLVRRRTIEESLRLMQRVHLIEEVHTEEGICYLAAGEAPSFVELLDCEYSRDLRARATWVSRLISELNRTQVEQLLKERIGRWTAEFQRDDLLGRNRP